MKNQFNIHKEQGDVEKSEEEQGATPYISISDVSNMQVESSHISLNNRNSSSYVNNQQNLPNHNNNLISSNNDFSSLSKSIINNNINISHNNNTNSGIQISFENVSLSGSNKLQISSNSIIFKKNDTSKNSIILSPSTLCNYYQQSNDVTPYKSPLIKQPEHEHELIHENEPSSGKEGHKLKQINIDILHKRKNTSGAINNRNINNININSNLNNINNNNCEITSRSDECSLDNNKTLSSQRKYVFDKKTPIKYAKNQLKSGEKNKSEKSNNNKLENNNSNSNIFENKNNNLEEEIKNKKNRGINVIQNKNGRNLMDTFDKVGNGKEADDNLKFFNNRRQPTEIHVPSEEFKINVNNNILDKNESNNNFDKKFIERLDDDSSFMEKDNNNKSNHEIEEINFLDKIKNNLKKEEEDEKNIYNDNNYNNNYINFRNEKIEKKKEDSIKDNNSKDTKEPNINTNLPVKKDEYKKISLKKVLPINKKDNNNNNITELSKNIIKELTRTNLAKRKENRTKSRPSSFTKNIIINFNSFNSIGVNNNTNNNNNIENNIGFKNKKPNMLIKKTKYNNEFKINNDIFDKKSKNKIINKNTNQDGKKNNITLEPLQIRRKIKIPNRLGKKEKYSKEISICNITNNKEKKRPPSSENYNRRATSFSNLKQTMNANLFHNNNSSNNNNINNNTNNTNNINNVNNNRNISKKSSRSNYSTGQKNINKNQFKKQKPLILNLFVEENPRQPQKNINERISHNQQIQNNNINNKNYQQENAGHKIIRKKIKLLNNKKDSPNSNTNVNSNTNITNNSNINSNIVNNNSHLNNNNINDRNYQTVSSVSRNVLDIKIRNKFNDKKDNEIAKKKDNKNNKSLLDTELNNNNNYIINNNIIENNYNVNNNNPNINNSNMNNSNMNNSNMNNSNINNSNINNNIQIKKKEDQKVKIIQNFSSYHKIKYKSHIPEKINFAETQPKQFNLVEDGFYNSNKNNNITKEAKKYNNNTYHHKGENNKNNYLNYNNDNKNNNNNIIKQVKFRKLEKLPGDSDSGDVDLNDECI